MRRSIVIIVCLMALLLPSCLTTRTNVKDYKAVEGKEYKFAKGKQCYLFWGLLPLGRTNVDTPSDGVCQIRTCYNFFDAFVSLITAGIFQMQTIKVMAKHEEPAAPVPPAVAAPQPAPAQQPAPQPAPAQQPAPQPAPAPAATSTAPAQNAELDAETMQVIFNQADVNKNGVIDESEKAAYNRMIERAKR